MCQVRGELDPPAKNPGGVRKPFWALARRQAKLRWPHRPFPPRGFAALRLALGVGHARSRPGLADGTPQHSEKVVAFRPGRRRAENVRTELRTNCDEFAKVTTACGPALKAKARLARSLPDVGLTQSRRLGAALRRVLRPREFPVARKLLTQGQERAKNSRPGASGPTQTGMIVRGYRSRSTARATVRPGSAGVVVGPRRRKFRLDLWWHGAARS